MLVLSLNVADIEGSMLLSCTATLALALVLPSDKLNKKIISRAKLDISQVDRSHMFTIKEKTQGKSAY